MNLYNFQQEAIDWLLWKQEQRDIKSPSCHEQLKIYMLRNLRENELFRNFYTLLTT